VKSYERPSRETVHRRGAKGAEERRGASAGLCGLCVSAVQAHSNAVASCITILVSVLRDEYPIAP